MRGNAMKNFPNAGPKTLKTYLDGDLRMPIGDITLTDKNPIDDFATAAYRQASGSLKRLMQPKWRIVVVDEGGGGAWLRPGQVEQADRYAGEGQMKLHDVVADRARENKG